MVVQASYHRFASDIGRAATIARRAVSAAGEVSAESYTVAIGLLASVTFWESGPDAAIPVVRDYLRRITALGLSDKSGMAVLAFLLAESGNLPEAVDAARRAFELGEDIPGHPLSTAAGHFALGRIKADQGNGEDARKQIRLGVALAEEKGEPLLSAYGSLILADIALDRAQARELVRKAKRLIEDLPDPGLLLDWVAARERRINRRGPVRTKRIRYVEELTRREHEVLRYLGGNLSQREIARELYISHNTVKGYVKNIYRKLGVSSRQDALESARELDLL